MERQRERASFNDVQPYVANCSYPCSRDELIACARDLKAPNNVIQTLQTLESGKELNDVNAVRRSIESF